jgi:SAM-dependent methyltransferase
MSESAPTSYDQVPYESYPFAQTHPDRLATVATLLGLKPAPVHRCRVLELGCASGGNLLPMAQTLPDSTFVGIDMSARQLADGQKILDELGLNNVALRHLSILDVRPELGRFDYIICHGVYSWVPANVQDKILEICAHNLAPNGVGYVSYNTYPGWHMRGMIRDIMCYHAKHFTEPRVRVKQARNLLDFLVKSVARENSPYSLLLKSELELIRNKADSYLYHEHLEDCNEPVYFYQFAERAEAKGLRYLGDVDLRVMTPGNFPREVESVLQMLSPDLLHLEQYMDFLRNRMFRQSLLCHQHITPIYALRPEQLTALYVASPAKPVNAKPDIHSEVAEEFRGADGVSLSAREPLVKAAMLYLSDLWPQVVPFETVRTTARARLSKGRSQTPTRPWIRDSSGKAC